MRRTGKLDACVLADVVKAATEGRSTDLPPLSVYVDGTDPLSVEELINIQKGGPSLKEFNIGPKSMPLELAAESESTEEEPPSS